MNKAKDSIKTLYLELGEIQTQLGEFSIWRHLGNGIIKIDSWGEMLDYIIDYSEELKYEYVTQFLLEGSRFFISYKKL